MKITTRLLFAFAFLFIAFLVAPSLAQTSQGELQPGVVAIPDDGSVIISNLTPTSVTLWGKVPDLKPGAVIAGGPAPGIMRRVVSVTPSGNGVTLQTTDVALTDVFKTAHMHFNGPVALGPLMPPEPKPDFTNYTFIKLTCDPIGKTATISASYDWNDSGRARVGRHEKDVYYLDDIIGKEVGCEVGDGQTVSVIGVKRDFPQDSGVNILLNHLPMRFGQSPDNDTTAHDAMWFTTAHGPLTMLIHSYGNGRYDARDCWDLPHGYLDEQYKLRDAKNRRTECRDFDITNSRAVFKGPLVEN